MASLLVDDSMDLGETIPTTFHRFVKLPPELRLMTWRVIANTPRTITFDWVIKKKSAPMVIEHTAKTVPAVLHVSHKARKISLRHYELYSSFCLKIRPFYINYDADTLMFGDWEGVQLFYAGLREGESTWPADLVVLESKVKFLAFGGQQLSPRFENYQWVLWRFNNLRELTLMERRPDVQNNGGFWSSRRWDLHLRELARAFKHLAGKNEGFRVRYMTENESWAMREEESAKNQKTLEATERKEREARNEKRKFGWRKELQPKAERLHCKTTLLSSLK